MDAAHDDLPGILTQNEEWLMNRVLEYAKRTQFTKFTSTLLEAWRVSIVGLTDALCQGLAKGPIPELDPDDNYTKDACAAFGIQSAQRHRSRGVTLAMFLGLMKYYRRGYEDLVESKALPEEVRRRYLRDISLFFDRVELGFATEWLSVGGEMKVAELSEATRKLANEKNQLLTIFESMADPTVLFLDDGTVGGMNHAAAMAFAGQALPGAARYGAVSHNAEVFEQTRARVMSETDEETFLLEGVETRAGPRTYELRLKPMLDVSGKFSGTVAFYRDLTEEREARRISEEKEASYRDLFANMLDGFAVHEMIFDENGKPADYRFLAVNPAFERLTGLRAEDIVGKRVLEVLPGTERYWIDSYGEVALTGVTLRYENFSADLGRHYEVFAYRPRAGQFACLVRDVTDQKRAEEEKSRMQEQLFQAQKVESVGRLAGGVAHDFNNMLSVILGHTELALELVGPNDPLHEDLEEIHRAARRSAEITRQLLAFARKQTISPKVLDLNATLEAMLKMIRRLIGEDIDLAWNPGKGLWKVKIDPGQVDQILANLATNARDAIAGVGHVTIDTDNAVVDAHYCEEHPGFVAGEYVTLSVSDDGCGIEREKMSSIFDPFFTTKEMGKGTGLGLATVYGIVKQNGGFINVYSEPGHGASFKIYLPRAKDAVLPGTVGVTAPARGSETLLIVEDEEASLRVLQRYLSSLGYRVFAANTPLEAIALAEGEAIDLVITDVVMPGMNGRDLAHKLTTAHPRLRCIFMSGYTANVIAHRGVLDDGVNFVQKPYSLREFGAKVRDVLDADERESGS